MLTGKRAGTPRPEAILLVLDSTNLSRHMMLAAPILSLGVPTLVILNMADDLRNRGGKLNLQALASELGAPVVLVSARQGEGIAQVFEFLAGVTPAPAPKDLPVLQDVPKCRAWAGNVTGRAAYRPPIPPKWTAPSGFRFSASHRRAGGFRAGSGRRSSRPSSASRIPPRTWSTG